MKVETCVTGNPPPGTQQDAKSEAMREMMTISTAKCSKKHVLGELSQISGVSFFTQMRYIVTLYSYFIQLLSLVLIETRTWSGGTWSSVDHMGQLTLLDSCVSGAEWCQAMLGGTEWCQVVLGNSGW